jgi:hypothetical protein
MALRDDLLGDIGDPEKIVNLALQARISADLLTFSQHLPDLTPIYGYYMQLENIAVVPVSTYEHWFKRQIHQNTRNKIRKAQKSDVLIRREKFTKKIGEGLMDIFNETPLRRGKRYPYFGKNIETIEKDWSVDMENSELLIAYYKGEIIGFIKILYSENIARTSGTIAKISHREKAPMNALIAKAVEITAEKRIPFLVYGNYTYGTKGEDSLTKFKTQNGFQKVDVPQYYIPLSLRGKICLRLGFHRGIASYLPKEMQRHLIQFRSLLYEKLIMGIDGKRLRRDNFH